MHYEAFTECDFTDPDVHCVSFTRPMRARIDTEIGEVAHYDSFHGDECDTERTCVLLVTFAVIRFAWTDGYWHPDGGAVDLTFSVRSPV